MITSTQAIKKDTPPNGVIAPRILIPVTDKTYKLPEKRMIPISINHPDQFNKEFTGKFPKRTPIIKMPTA